MSREQNKPIVRRWSKWWMFAALAMIIALVASGAGASPASASSNLVPFAASFSGSVAMTGPDSALLSGSGNATHMGKSEYTGNVSAITPTLDGFTDVLVETLVAANGDTLTILCIQTAVQTSPGVFVGTDQWTVIAGTGRFAGATGSGTGITHVDLNNFKFDKQLTGIISAPNGN
jgi:hypothetical protein